MGQRTGSETVIAIIDAFWRSPVWSQAELARQCGVSPRAVRRHLDELVLKGWPLDRDDDPPQVYWTVPKGWFPSGVLLEPDSVASLIRILGRVPPTRERERLITALSSHAPRVVVDALTKVIPPRTSEVEEAFLPAVLDGLADQPLRMRYITTSRASVSNRTISVQRVLVGPPTRFVAWCHQAQELRNFRLESVASLAPDPAATYHPVDDAEIETFLAESVDGYHGKERVRVAFFVRDPEARWVAQNLPEGLDGTPEDGGLYVEAETTGLLPVARFVAGLGAAAECRTPELAAQVRELAEGALRGAKQA